MATRKDSKGRLLRRGEAQRKDGRYCYKYVDAKGADALRLLVDLDSSRLYTEGEEGRPLLAGS